MTDKAFNYAKLLGAQADKFGYKAGEKLPDIVVGLLDFLVRKGHLGSSFEELVPGAHGIIKKVLQYLAQVGEVPLSVIQKFLPGFAGEVGYEFANEFIDALGRGAGDSPKAGEKPTDKAKASTDDGSRKGYVIQGVWYPVGCTHVPEPVPFAPKGQPRSEPARITLIQAIERLHQIHPFPGCVTQEEIAFAKAKLAAATTTDTDQAPAATPATKSATPSVKLGDYLLRWRTSDPDGYITHVSERFLPATAADQSLKIKFYKAFKGGISYDTFVALLKEPPREWHALLDAFIDEIPTVASESTLERELRQFSGMLDGLKNKVLDPITPWAAEQSKCSKKRVETFQAQCEERDEKRAARATVRNYVLSGVVLLAFLIYLYSHNYLPS